MTAFTLDYLDATGIPTYGVTAQGVPFIEKVGNTAIVQLVAPDSFQDVNGDGTETGFMDNIGDTLHMATIDAGVTVTGVTITPSVSNTGATATAFIGDIAISTVGISLATTSALTTATNLATIVDGGELQLRTVAASTGAQAQVSWTVKLEYHRQS